MMPTQLARDVSASFVVFLVAVPLCMGIAIASGVPPERGLIAGIVGGIVVGLLSGSPLQVSGPAAGLVVMVFDLIEAHGIGALGPVLVLAGLLQCAAGLLKLGRWFRAISPAVVHGMLAGIGILIVAGQLHVLLDRKPMAGGLDNLLAAPSAFLGLLPLDGVGGEAALLIGLITIAGMLAWERWRPDALRLVPGALIGVVTASAATAALSLPVLHVNVPDRMWEGMSLPDAGAFGALLQPGLMMTAVALAFIASAESLLSASAVDRMQDRVRTDYDRELVAQGVGNGVSGLLGGLPVTGVIVRSSANVQAGAQTRLAAVLHGVLILAFVAAAPGVLRAVPTAALAGVLVVTGWRLVSLRHVRELLHAHGWMPVAIWGATCIGVVAVDLLTGVLTGLALSVAESVQQARSLGFRMRRTETDGGTELRLAGTATFLRLPQLLAAVEAEPGDRPVRIRTRGLRHTDHTFASALQQLAARSGTGGRKIVVG
jgi:MFS superfamily sulfate permease-like transporter